MVEIYTSSRGALWIIRNYIPWWYDLLFKMIRKNWSLGYLNFDFFSRRYRNIIFWNKSSHFFEKIDQWFLVLKMLKSFGNLHIGKHPLLYLDNQMNWYNTSVWDRKFCWDVTFVIDTFYQESDGSFQTDRVFAWWYVRKRILIKNMN